MTAVVALLERHWRFRTAFWASARIELRKRYAGSLLGPAWAVLYPLLFLSVYLFVWLVVFRAQVPGYSRFDYVLYVFGGLVPYLFFVEALTAASVAIRQNMHLVKNVILPIELVPGRAVIVALAGHAVGLALLIALAVVNDAASWRLVILPLVIVCQLLWLTGLAWILAPVGALLPDTSYLVALAMMLLMFLSPIAFSPEMVPAPYRILITGNPITYMAGAYRSIVLPQSTPPADLLVFASLALLTFLLGGLAWTRFKGFILDFE